MYKRIFSVIISLMSTTALAQTPYFQNSTTAAPSQQKALSGLQQPSQKVMSPSDFSSTTAKISSQNQSQFQQQLNQKLSQVPPPKILTPPGNAYGNIQAPSTKPTEQNATTPAAETSPEETMDETGTPAAAPTVAAPAPAPTNTAPTTTTTPTQKSQPYTGFGTQSGGGQQGQGNTSGGGWNVKY